MILRLHATTVEQRVSDESPPGTSDVKREIAGRAILYVALDRKKCMDIGLPGERELL